MLSCLYWVSRALSRFRWRQSLYSSEPPPAAIAAAFAAIFLFNAASVIVGASRTDLRPCQPYRRPRGASSRKRCVSEPPDVLAAPDGAAGSHSFPHRLAIV